MLSSFENDNTFGGGNENHFFPFSQPEVHHNGCAFIILATAYFMALVQNKSFHRGNVKIQYL